MNETYSKPFTETWDGTPNIATAQAAPAENQVTETTRPMGDAKFAALLATLGERVAAITAPPVAEAEPAAPTPQEQPPVVLHELSVDEFRAHAAGYWDQALSGHRPPPPLTVSQYLTSAE
jgi:hypothetical protein